MKKIFEIIEKIDNPKSEKTREKIVFVSVVVALVYFIIFTIL